jgi:hypothetical protein
MRRYEARGDPKRMTYFRTHASPDRRDRRRPVGLDSDVPSSDPWRAWASYALLGTAFLTSPLLLPFALALLMAALRGTPLGSAVLQQLHLVFIASFAYCLTALAAACVFYPRASLEAGSRDLPPGLRRVPDPRHRQLQGWLVARGHDVDDATPGAR